MTPALSTRQDPSEPKTARHTAGSDEAVTRLALAARDGDPEKTDRFVRALQRDVWRYVAFLSADPQAADDLTQDVFVRALPALPRFEGRSSARTWLLSIARRTVVDSIRRSAARPRLSDRHDWQTAAEQAQPQGLPGFEDGIALAELLATIPEDRREAFILTQLLGLPYVEAAEAIGCPIGTVRSRVARARSSLMALLTDVEVPEAERDRPVPQQRRAATATEPALRAVALLA
ncbi:sigma-70 family RNA polymerase sigma factor [Streptomyces sp. WAC06614]|uniref:sigma-70 family RNA polymerase sigma factor n=1 Tax=Streptomyces sp. WAC06614 TaxID=2487416 RepID=UPI000F76B4DD|nr:sigma-70 family RNA polymerase sigma factor [Streptomyces sp. WAC06614]RSS78950.1 sigma-70 family RNA polymerase sigma factor [Streptomyces sp. WAC06614]